ncbi:MAG: hypothetical protein IPK28_10325 [Devosia sp.]|nr:hypothetical protein [Devosia sp.]
MQISGKDKGILFRLSAAVIAGVTSLMVVGGTALSQPVTPQSVDPLQHFLDCAGVLISDPDVHAAYCAPNTIPPELGSLASSGGGGSPECVADDVFDDTDDCGPDDIRDDLYGPP